jgi:hypothetical protein
MTDIVFPIIHSYLPQLTLRDKIRLHATLVRPVLSWELSEFLELYQHCEIDSVVYLAWITRLQVHKEWHGRHYRLLHDCQAYYDVLEGILLLQRFREANK